MVMRLAMGKRFELRMLSVLCHSMLTIDRAVFMKVSLASNSLHHENRRKRSSYWPPRL